MVKGKIFGIGLAKTGTTSLNDAFSILGITSIGCPANISEIKQFDAATDGIVADRIEELDRAFPGSKFIYTVRDRKSWLQSYTRHKLRSQSSLPGADEMVKRLYGTTGLDEGVLSEAYERHERYVNEYFKDRPDDLLVFDVCGGLATWEKLCKFLGEPIPDEPFPHNNQKFSDAIFLHFLYYLKDPLAVSAITKTPIAYLKNLSAENFDPSDLLNENPTKRVDRILAKSCKHFGGVAKAAGRLNLPKEFLSAAIKRHKQRQNSRKTNKRLFAIKVRRMFRLID